MRDSFFITSECCAIADNFQKLTALASSIVRAAEICSESIAHGGKVLFCGNGGSAADAQHLAAELVGRYEMDRPAMNAIALTTDTSILTAVGNDYGYVHEPEKFVLIDGIIPFCRRAQELGYAIIVITNQSGIARGYFSETDYERLTAHMIARFHDEGITITDVLHSPDLDGPDRKPAPGLFLKAIGKHKINPTASFNLGDKPRDVEAGRAAGVGTNVLFNGQYPVDQL